MIPKYKDLFLDRAITSAVRDEIARMDGEGYDWLFTWDATPSYIGMMFKQRGRF